MMLDLYGNGVLISLDMEVVTLKVSQLRIDILLCPKLLMIHKI